MQMGEEEQKDAQTPQDAATIVYTGGEIKALGDGRIGGYLVRFSTPTDPDLVGDFFTKSTYFGTNDRPPVLYHHGMDGHLKARPIGEGRLKMDDVGLWIDAQLNLRDEYEKAVYDRMVVPQKAGWSSGASTYEREYVGNAGWLKTWIIGEASITPTPAEPRNTAMAIKALPLPPPLLEDDAQEAAVPEASPVEAGAVKAEEAKEEPVTAAVAAPKKMELKETGLTADQVQGIVQEAVKAALAASAEKALPDTPPAEKSAPAVVVDASHWKYDNSTGDDLALTYAVVESGGKYKPSDGLVKALAMRMDAAEARQSPSLSAAIPEFRKSLILSGRKANELNYSTQANYGDEWVGVAYSSALWESIRQGTFVMSRIPSFEFPAGVESMIIPLESTDPTWYKVGEATAMGSNPGGVATNTVTASKLGTAKQTMALGKIGASTLWSGELEESSVLPFAAQLRAQFAISGAETLESIFLDADSEAGATTNINDIAGTPGGTEYWITFNGARKLALVTNTANSRDAGTLAVEDYLETLKLMGAAGKNALDRSKVFFVITPGVHYKSLELLEVKTDDVRRAGGTVTDGVFNRIYGVDVLTSAHLCKPDPNGAGLSNATGKIDQDTAGNNTKGTIVAVRGDQWRVGYRRRMTLETQRIPRADAYELTALMRFGQQYRDTEAAAVSYNITV